MFDDRIEKGSDGWNADFSKPITRGPVSVAFQKYFGISASLDMVPYVFIDNDHVTTQPDRDLSFPMIAEDEAPKGSTRKGPGVTGFTADGVLPTLARTAVSWIDEQATAKKPFFLYLPLNSPHTPVAPTLLEHQVAAGRSTPGTAQPNTGTIDIWHGRPALRF